MIVDSIFRYLLQSVRAAPSADNSQPWCIRRSGPRSAVIAYAEDRVGGHTFGAMEPATLLALGAVLENMEQASRALDIGFEICRWPEEQSGGSYFELTWGESSEFAADESPEDLALFDRYTDRSPFKRMPVPQEVLSEVAAFAAGQARALSSVGQSVRDVAVQVRASSEVRFQTQEVHEWLANSLRFSPDEAVAGDGLDVSTLALPPGGAALLRFLSPWSRMRMLNRIGAYKLMAAIEAAPVKSAPALVGIISPSAKDDLLDAGMLMERVWIALNAAGLAVHPYYVIADQIDRLGKGRVPAGLEGQVRAIEANCGALLKLRPDEKLQMLFRVGYPTREAVRSRRLPDAELIVT